MSACSSGEVTNGFVSTSSSGAQPNATDRAALSRTASELTAASTPGNGAYRIGPQDLLEVTVFKVPDLSRTVQVGDNGSINYPLVGEVRAGGRTAQEVERTLTSQLGARYLQSPQVSVIVKEFNSQRVTVEGAVKKPGVIPIRGGQTLVQMIAQAGGLDTDTSSKIIVVFRPSPRGRMAARFDLDAIQSGKAEDPVILQGDTIFVDTSQGKIAFGYIVKALPAAALFTLL